MIENELIQLAATLTGVVVRNSVSFISSRIKVSKAKKMEKEQ